MKGQILQKDNKSNIDESLEYLSPKELAHKMGVSIDTVYRLLNKGEIPFVRCGNRTIRIHRDVYGAWRHRQEESSSK